MSRAVFKDFYLKSSWLIFRFLCDKTRNFLTYYTHALNYHLDSKYSYPNRAQ